MANLSVTISELSLNRDSQKVLTDAIATFTAWNFKTSMSGTCYLEDDELAQLQDLLSRVATRILKDVTS